MERLTISASDEFADELSAFMQRRGYDNRSEAVRDLARKGLGRTMFTDGVAANASPFFPTTTTTGHAPHDLRHPKL
jgi:Arc/MetJ-type ribon-helix-helix transcriptional regulator